jgi:hypothetical protein
MVAEISGVNVGIAFLRSRFTEEQMSSAKQWGYSERAISGDRWPCFCKRSPAWKAHNIEQSKGDIEMSWGGA